MVVVHKQIYEKFQILHQDVSGGNIIILTSDHSAGGLVSSMTGTCPRELIGWKVAQGCIIEQ